MSELVDHHVRLPDGTRNAVEAWSIRRLPFEPKGTAITFRKQLVDALRSCNRGGSAMR